MANLKRTSWGVVGAMLVCAGPSVFAQASMTLTGAGNNGAIADVYVGPYQGTIDGVSTPIICDDFYDDTYLNESWTATVSTFSNLSQTKFGASDITQYEEAAWLAQQLVNPSSTCPDMSAANCAGDIQFAIWEVFDNGQPFSLLSGHNLQNAEWWLNQAETQTFTAGEFSDVTIYTPTGCSANCGGGLPQEFLTVSTDPPVATPEPSELALLVMDFSCVGGLLYLLHSRRIRA